MRCFSLNPWLGRGSLRLCEVHNWNLRTTQRSFTLASKEATAVTDGRTRLSQLWVPTGGIAVSQNEDSHAKLVRAGFLRQAHSGIFHMLPLGRRVQEKLEALIDKHMYRLGASKVSLSSISSQELWSKSGRLANAGSELFLFKDRKEANYLLSPTHEEEITTLISGTVKSYKELPIRVYQISRKYRDERRPRHGLLRSREFIMKDLYTFDCNPTLALETYHQVRAAYAELFNDLKIPYLVAEADSGDIGGDLSHEFHFPTSIGEDHIISCSKCEYVANEELAESRVLAEGTEMEEPDEEPSNVQVWHGISQDRESLVNVWYVSNQTPGKDSVGVTAMSEVNIRAVKAVLPELDTSVDDPISFWAKGPTANNENPRSPRRLINLLDHTLPSAAKANLRSNNNHLNLLPVGTKDLINRDVVEAVFRDSSDQRALNLLRIKNGDACPRCPNGILRVQKAIELGHTFHLGTRYSEPLSATIKIPLEAVTESQRSTKDGSQPHTEVAMQMGCHGIGVSRIIGAVADTLADKKGLNWPRVMAPFEAVIIPSSKALHEVALDVYDALGNNDIDTILDDRSTSFPWKIQDADLIGYPIIVIVGKSWISSKQCEVQCRRLNVCQQVPFAELSTTISSLLEQL